VLLFQVLASYWSVGFGTFLQVSAFASHWLEKRVNFTPMPEENHQYSANQACKLSLHAILQDYGVKLQFS
jgi:hypothetical protein